MPDTVQRTIKYYYHTVKKERKDGSGESEDFNLADWLINQTEDPGCQTIICLKDCNIRLETIERDDCNGDQFYFARVYKVRDTNIPAKLKEGQAAEPISLEDDEYIGEDLNLLYDYQLGVCMMQRNRMSIGISRLSEWAGKSEPEHIVVFRPIGDICDVSRFRSKKIRSFEVSLGNVNNLNGTSLSDMIGGILNLGGVSVRISISAGRKKDAQLVHNDMLNIIENVDFNRDSVVSAKVKIKDDDDSPAEVVDLIDDMMNDIITFDIERKSTLDFRVAKEKMLEKYIERRDEIAKKIGRR